MEEKEYNIIYFRNENIGELSKIDRYYFQEDFIKELFKSTDKITYVHQDYVEGKTYKNVILYCEDLRKYRVYFEKFAQQKFMLIHLFDENLNHDISIYSHKNLVHIFREMIRPAIPQHKITTIPLGYKSGLPRNPVNTHTHRPYKWSFCGFLNKNGRDRFVEALKDIKPHYIFNTKATWSFDLNATEYSDILQKTIFVPCFAGNTNIDTQRVVEALENGCIPIVNKYYKFPYLRTRYMNFDYHNYVYYEHLFNGSHPLPVVDNSYTAYWSKNGYYSMFADKIKTLLIEEDIEALRQKIITWWNNFKQQLKTHINETVLLLNR
jgi:hypothetical protein